MEVVFSIFVPGDSRNLAIMNGRKRLPTAKDPRELARVVNEVLS